MISNPRRPDNPLEIANAAFCSLTGYAETEIVGRNCRFLAGDATGAFELFHPAVRIEQPGSLPHGGWHVGHVRPWLNNRRGR